jgi:hypothetical protein
LDKLMVSATTIRSLDETIEKDFGKAHAAIIKLFLDNRPSGYPVEPELKPYVKTGPRPERVLRLAIVIAAQASPTPTSARHLLTAALSRLASAVNAAIKSP